MKDPTDKLYNAVADYIKSNGGSVAVIGGIAIVDWGGAKLNYGLVVRITGKKPNFTPPKGEKE